MGGWRIAQTMGPPIARLSRRRRSCAETWVITMPVAALLGAVFYALARGADRLFG